MLMPKLLRLTPVVFSVLLGAGFYSAGYFQAKTGTDIELLSEAHAAAAAERADGWSPTGTSPNREVYYPGTEELAPDEMRVIACGSGMPMPRLKQAAACMLVELGNGDKFIFDIGTGSMERLYALGIPLDYIDKVFLTHLHADHMGDLPAFYIYGPQNNRSVPLRVWGPGGGGTRPEWGAKAAMDSMLDMWAWMTETLAGTIDTRSMKLEVTEYDWSKVNGVIYEENGVVIRSIPAVHFEQAYRKHKRPFPQSRWVSKTLQWCSMAPWNRLNRVILANYA